MTREQMDEQHQVWESWAQADPLWAILSDPNQKGGKWDIDEFFANGVVDIDELLEATASRGLTPRRGRSLDFGCGIGRLTQALAAEFEHVDGVDISETMVSLAREHNRFGDRCTFHVNGEPDLSLFDDGVFDLVFSTIVLQHNPPDLAQSYIEEFVRILAPGGIAVFDMPEDLKGVPFPEQSHTAVIDITTPTPRMVAGQPTPVTVAVTNVSQVDWPAGTRLAIGNHWRTPDGGTVVVQDDARHPLSDGLAQGATVRAELVVTPPGPGGHMLEVDLVEEGVCWFANMGSEPARVSIKVARPGWRPFRDRGAAAGSGPARTDDDEPVPFAMSGLPRERVVAAVTAAGADVVDMEPTEKAGSHWDSMRYFVRRP